MKPSKQVRKKIKKNRQLHRNKLRQEKCTFLQDDSLPFSPKKLSSRLTSMPKNPFLMRLFDFIDAIGELLTSIETRWQLINLLRNTIPTFFEVKVFGSAVHSIYSGIEPHDLDLVVKDAHEKAKFIKSMYLTFGTKFRSAFTAIEKCKTYHLQHNQITLKIDVLLEENMLMMNRDFQESDLLWGPKGLELKDTLKDIPDLEESKDKEKRKSFLCDNLRKRRLTFYPNEWYQSAMQKITLLQRYLKKQQAGYDFIHDCPGYEKLHSRCYCHAHINKCSYCKKDLDTFSITPECQCGHVKTGLKVPLVTRKKQFIGTSNRWYYSYNRSYRKQFDEEGKKQTKKNPKEKIASDSDSEDSSNESLNSNTTVYNETQWFGSSGRTITGFHVYCHENLPNLFHLHCFQHIIMKMKRLIPGEDGICYHCECRFI
jgi:hypothetical protein